MMSDPFQIRFQGSFAEGLEFVETENLDGEGVSVGEWEREDDYWLLKIGGDDE